MPQMAKDLRIGFVVAAFAAAVLSACANGSGVAPVNVSFANDGAVPLACRLMYGHWVDRDLGTLAPGASVEFPVEQQRSDGALFTMRPDGRERMMIETIQCGIYPDWMASVGQVDFAPARRQEVAFIRASCSAPPAGGRIVCPPIEMK
jgi:hypothetical protein